MSFRTNRPGGEGLSPDPGEEPELTPSPSTGADLPGTEGSPGASGQPAAPSPTPPAPTVPEKPPRTRISTAFSGLVAGAILLILLLIFILENTQSVKISWLGLGGHIALGVALLLAAVGGAALVGILGLARIGQVRRHARRRLRSRAP
jgi:uncharacterized integral membrane protein